MTDVVDYIYNPIFWVVLNAVLAILIVAVIHNVSRLKNSLTAAQEGDKEYEEILMALRDGPSDAAALSLVVNRFLDYSCRRLGVELPRGATHREVIKALSAARPDEGGLLSDLSRLYEPIRFGGKEPTEEDLSSLKAILLGGLERVKKYAA